MIHMRFNRFFVVLCLLTSGLVLAPGSPSQAQENQDREVTLTIEGRYNWQSLISLVWRRHSAKNDADKNIRELCENQKGGTLKSDVEFKVLRDDEGCVCTVVQAKGTCSIPQAEPAEVPEQPTSPKAGAVQ